MMKIRPWFVWLSLLLVLTLMAACDKKAPTATATVEPTAETAAATEAATVAVTEAPLPPNEDSNALPPEPQPVTISAADGVSVSGYYYPGGRNPGPLVVLMHWAGGDQNDWNEIAVWLQNRGQANPFPNPGDMPWWDPSWFPPVPEDKSYGVLVFTFRGCQPYEAGCTTFEVEGWLQDAQAAMLKARELEGVDPQRIVAMGSSIGADGAPDGCLFVNQQFPDTCQGSLSLSPGNYLNVPYANTVLEMGMTVPPTAAWCLADEKEYGICEATEAVANNPAFRGILVPDGSHGNMMLREDVDPQPMQLMLDFLNETLPEPAN